jgi:uncharacterized OB-fold protein
LRLFILPKGNQMKEGMSPAREKRRMKYELLGQKCGYCNNVSFGDREVCPNCRKELKKEQKVLSHAK